MADRASARITIGGTLSRSLLEDFTRRIEEEDARLDWEGEPFTADAIPVAGPLELMAHEVAWGNFGRLEDFCHEHGLSYVRWSGGSPGSFGPERIVFTGVGDPVRHAVTDDDELVFDLEAIRRLGSIAAIEAQAVEADFTPGSLTILDADFPPVGEARHG